ncbi:MAG: diguanylate cyclase [Thermodesulfovibrionales bacterium]|jgi:diguanylate cyclase (GGDEF)-like protein/PAS domain S-box-containing protein
MAAAQARIWKGDADRLVALLLRLTNLQVAVSFVLLAVAFSMVIVFGIDLLWDGRFNAELQFAGVVTPLIDGMLVVGILVMLLGALRREGERRRLAEHVLTEAQRIAHIGSWDLDLETDTLTWSEETNRIFEINKERFGASYEAFLRQVHPEDRTAVDSAYRQSIKDNQPYQIRHRLLMPDGRIKYVFERGETIFADGRPARTIGTVQDVTERVALEMELEKQATTDALTGIPNRYRFNETLGHEIERCRRYGVPLSLVMFDIDNFKNINDTHGHDVGDEVLKHIARTVRAMIRNSDFFARWGGEEFMILATHTGLEDGARLAERLRAGIEGKPYGTIGVTLSFGVTAYRNHATVEDLLKCADDALYEAKNMGRNQVRIKAYLG